MAYTFEELKHKTLAELRDIAKGDDKEVVQGYTQMNKEHLVVALAKALGIQHEHHDVVGIDKGGADRHMPRLTSGAHARAPAPF